MPTGVHSFLSARFFLNAKVSNTESKLFRKFFVETPATKIEVHYVFSGDGHLMSSIRHPKNDFEGGTKQKCSHPMTALTAYCNVDTQ